MYQHQYDQLIYHNKHVQIHVNKFLLNLDKELITAALDNKINLWNIGEFLETAKKDSKTSKEVIDNKPYV